MNVYPLRYTKADLERAPRDEALLFIMGGQIANDINQLRKLLIFSLNSVEDGAGLNAPASGMAMLISRMSAGRIHEAHCLLAKKENALLIQSLASRLGDEAAAARTSMNRYFGKSDHLIGRLRNSVAFHTSRDLAAETFETFPADEPLVDLLTVNRGDCFFGGADLLGTWAMLGLTGEPDRVNAAHKLGLEVADVAGWFEDLLHAYVLWFLETYIEDEWRDARGRPLKLRDPPSLFDVLIPFFTSATSVAA